MNRRGRRHRQRSWKSLTDLVSAVAWAGAAPAGASPKARRPALAPARGARSARPCSKGVAQFGNAAPNRQAP